MSVCPGSTDRTMPLNAWSFPSVVTPVIVMGWFAMTEFRQRLPISHLRVKLDHLLL